MVVQFRCEAERINSVLWSLSLVPIVFMLVYTPLVQASVDDDIELQFCWTPATGNISYYNIYLFVYDSPDAPGPSSEDDYRLVDDTFYTHGSDPPTLDNLYTLRDTLYELRGDTEPITIEYGKGYQIQVAAVDDSDNANIIVGPRSELSEIVWHIKYGDTSGDGLVSDHDADLVSQFAAGSITFTPLQLIAGDVSGSGTVSSYDAGLIKQYVAGVIDTFPVEQVQPATVDSGTASLAAEASAGVQITAPDLTGHAGDNVTVLINISDVTSLGIIGVDFTLKYDATILTATGATTLGTVAESWGEPYLNVTPGQIVIPMSGILPLTGSGRLVSISFHVSADASVGSVSELNIIRADLNEGGIPATIANGSLVTISVNSPENVTSMVLLDGSDHSYDKYTNETSLIVTWTNTDTSRLFRPLLMVIENTLPSSIYVTNADGTTPDGKPYYDYSDHVSGGKLDPGKTSGAKKLIFSGPKNILRRIRFTFDVSCWAVVESSTAVESVASLSITVDPILDSDSSSFIPPTDVPPGWHLISIPVQPIDRHPSAVLSSIEGKYSSAWAYDPDAGWSVYAPGLPGGLQSMEPGRGYWIKMEKEGTLDVEGNDPEQTDITLIGGKWNLVGYSSQDPRYAEECMEHVSDAIISVWEYDPDTGWSVYEPGSPGDLILMKPWRGYWIKADQTCKWDVNKTSTSAAPSAAAK